MNIEIKNRFTGEIIISGKYESLKELVEKNSTYLRDADLRDADLGVKIPPINSHDFIVEILKREAGENIKYLKYIGIIILMREWCWEDFLEKLPKSFIKWAQKILCDKWPKDFNSCFGGDK